ncbi:MAG: UPF0175 family protein [Candidatus Riflebacteria bacterium]|nr:UPF0175 family protein [Candidatus Riflebacteria bacterium]
MKERQVTIRYPEALLVGLKTTAERFEKEAALMLAVKLYELRRISSGMAGRIAGLDRVTFLFTLQRYDVPVVDLTEEEFTEEVRNA